MSPHKLIQEDYVARNLAEAWASYSNKNPLSSKLHEAASAYMPGGNTRTVLYAQPFPLTITFAAGKSIKSADGRVYTDFLGEYSAGLFGHSNGLIKKALTEALESGWNFGAESRAEKDLACKVTERFSKGGMELVRFTNSGTEANTMAIAAAILYTGRKKVLVFSNSYHGATLMFPLDLCRWMHSKSSDPAPWTTLNLPHDFVTAPFNNVQETSEIIGALPTDSLAAILVETVQGSGGCRPARPEFISFLRKTATDLGALLIVDEVMTSRLGSSGILATLDIKADLMTLGKWIAGGMSFGAFGGRKDIMEMFNPSLAKKGPMHAGTFNNNALSMTAGLVALEIFSAEKVADLNRRGDRIKAGITEILLETGLYPQKYDADLRDIIELDSFTGQTQVCASDGQHFPAPKVNIASRGSLLNVRFAGPNSSLWHGLYYHHLLDNGIYIATRGFTPISLEITDEDADRFVQVVREFIVMHLDALKDI